MARCSGWAIGGSVGASVGRAGVTATGSSNVRLAAMAGGGDEEAGGGADEEGDTHRAAVYPEQGLRPAIAAATLWSADHPKTAPDRPSRAAPGAAARHPGHPC